MKTQIEVQKENVKILLDLINENPELRIIPMVDYEVLGGEDFRYWLGLFDKSEIDYICGKGERIYFKSSDLEELIENEIDNIYDEAQFYMNHIQCSSQ